MTNERAAHQARMLNESMDAAEALDPKGMLRYYAVDAVFELPFAPPGFPARLEGKAAISEFFDQFPRYYRSIRLLDRRISPLADGTGLVAEYRGEWENVKGRPYNNTYIAVIRFRDDEMIHVREFFDPQVWLASLARPPAANDSA